MDIDHAQLENVRACFSFRFQCKDSLEKHLIFWSHAIGLYEEQTENKL